MEKKLTDEATLDSLKELAIGISGKGAYAYVYRMIVSAIDLIHRLQSEVQRLKNGQAESAKTAVETLEENIKLRKQVGNQKAEIERLTKEHERIAWSKQEYLDWVHGFLSTHTDMKDRGEKYEMFDREWMCNVFWAKIKGSIEYIIDLENQRDELQKQVDELKAYAEDIYKKAVDREEDAYSLGFDKGKEQAVKDTASEILQEIFSVCKNAKEKLDYMYGNMKTSYGEGYKNSVSHFTEHILKIAREKGVEVE